MKPQIYLRLSLLLPYLLWGIALLLVQGLLMWSVNRQVNILRKVFAASPFILTVLILIEINLLSVATQDPSFYSSLADFKDLMALNGRAVVLTLAGGYLCVGIAFGLYKLLQHLKVIKENNPELQPVATEAL